MLKNLITSASIAGLLLLSSCAATLLKPIKESDKDTTGEYNGTWTLTQKALAANQSVGDKLFKCTFYNSTAIIRVNNGVGQLRYGKYSGKGNISNKGAFYIEIPTEHGFKSSSGTNSSQNAITYIFKGFLAKDASKGLYTIGMAELNNSGCSTKLTIVPAA